METWIEQFKAHILEYMGEQVCFIGIQGSYARGEAAENSDIDVVVIFQEASMEILRQYRQALDGLPHREKICGFVSGREELRNWEPSELFQFYYDTTPLYGKLEDLLSFEAESSARQAVHTGACSIYHGCVHNYLHERDDRLLAGLCKMAVFVMQAEYFCKTGQYIRRHAQLMPLLPEEEREIMGGYRTLKNGRQETGEFDRLTELLIVWAGQLMKRRV